MNEQNKPHLTVVYSTREYSEEYQKHIKNTIGKLSYDILFFVNDGNESLAKLYNKAIFEAKSDIIVLIHDDIVFKTDNWGEKLYLLHQKHIDYSIIGLAGAKTLPESGKWWESPNTYGIVEHIVNNKPHLSYYSYPIYSGLENVMVIDGVFMSINKKLFDGFDEDFDGFHFYDIESSYNSAYFKGVTTDIRIQHNSIGILPKEWDYYKRLFFTKYPDASKCQVISDMISTTNYNLPINQDSRIDIIIKSNESNITNTIKIIHNLSGSKYTNYHIHILGIDKILDLKHDNISIDPIPINSDKDVLNYIKTLSSDVLCYIDGNIRLYDDILYQTMMHYHQDMSIGVRTHSKNSLIHSIGASIQLIGDVVEITNNNHGLSYDYDLEPISSVTFGEYFFVCSMNELKKYLFSANTFMEIGVNMVFDGFKHFCLNNVAIQIQNNHTNPHILNKELTTKIKKIYEEN